MEQIAAGMRTSTSGTTEGLLISSAGFYGIEGNEYAFGGVFHIPQLASLVELTPSVSTVRIVGSRSIEEVDPFSYDHVLRADGMLRAIALPGKLPEQDWDY